MTVFEGSDKPLLIDIVVRQQISLHLLLGIFILHGQVWCPVIAIGSKQAVASLALEIIRLKGDTRTGDTGIGKYDLGDKIVIKIGRGETFLHVQVEVSDCALHLGLGDSHFLTLAHVCLDPSHHFVNHVTGQKILCSTHRFKQKGRHND